MKNSLLSAQFDITILHLNWVKHEDDPTDLCAHGSLYVRVGNKVVVDEKDGDGWTLSAAALNLLRSLERDYKPGDFAGKLIPCCGFFLIANDEGDKVDICGCPSGFDWMILHKGSEVLHIADTGEEAVIDFDSYKHLILVFAERVQQFYKNSKPKKLPEDDFDRKGYEAFWTEWNILRSRWG